MQLEDIDGTPHEPDEEYLKQQLIIEIQQLKKQLSSIRNRSAEMRGISLALGDELFDEPEQDAA